MVGVNRGAAPGGMTATFDIAAAKAYLHRMPATDRDRFIKRAIKVHAS